MPFCFYIQFVFFNDILLLFFKEIRYICSIIRNE